MIAGCAGCDTGGGAIGACGSCAATGDAATYCVCARGFARGAGCAGCWAPQALQNRAPTGRGDLQLTQGVWGGEAAMKCVRSVPSPPEFR